MTEPGADRYRIDYLDSVVEEDIPNLPKTMGNIIKKAIEERLTIDPVGLGKPLRYSLKGHRRLRVGDYRIIYRVDAEKRVVTIVIIKHRKAVHERSFRMSGFWRDARGRGNSRPQSTLPTASFTWEFSSVITEPAIHTACL